MKHIIVMKCTVCSFRCVVAYETLDELYRLWDCGHRHPMVASHSVT